MDSGDVLLSYDDLKRFGIRLCRDRVRVLVKRGLFPEPVRVGSYKTAWRRSAIVQWVAELPDASARPVPARGIVRRQAAARSTKRSTRGGKG